MPIYEYRCASGHRFEELQGFNSERVAFCPRCGSKSERQISVSAVHFKGSGFYSTDSRSTSSATRSSSSPSSESASSNGTAEGSADKAAAPSTNGATSDSGSKAKTTHTHGGS